MTFKQRCKRAGRGGRHALHGEDEAGGRSKGKVRGVHGSWTEAQGVEKVAGWGAVSECGKMGQKKVGKLESLNKHSLRS